jgi:hypothetical protein
MSVVMKVRRVRSFSEPEFDVEVSDEAEEREDKAVLSEVER